MTIYIVALELFVLVRYGLGIVTTGVLTMTHKNGHWLNFTVALIINTAIVIGFHLAVLAVHQIDLTSFFVLIGWFLIANTEKLFVTAPLKRRQKREGLSCKN